MINYDALVRRIRLSRIPDLIRTGALFEFPYQLSTTRVACGLKFTVALPGCIHRTVVSGRVLL